MDAPYNAYGDGIHDDAAAIAAATAEGDVCFPSGHTFLFAIGRGPSVSIATSHTHWQAGMIGGAAPILTQPIPRYCSGASENCTILDFNGPFSGSITGDSVVGLDFEGPYTNRPVTYQEWDIPIYARHNTDNLLVAGNTFNAWGGNAEVLTGGALDASACVVGPQIVYNSFSNCGIYGLVMDATQGADAHDNVSVDCAEGVENDNTSQCTGGNVFNNELVSCDTYGLAYREMGYCAFLTGGSASGANYTGNTVENSTVSGIAGSGNRSALYKAASGGEAVYTNDSCINGCVIVQ